MATKKKRYVTKIEVWSPEWALGAVFLFLGAACFYGVYNIYMLEQDFVSGAAAMFMGLVGVGCLVFSGVFIGNKEEKEFYTKEIEK